MWIDTAGMLAGAAMLLSVGWLAGVLTSSLTDRRLDAEKSEPPPDDICGLCGRPGADKVPSPVRWPGERVSCEPLVHAECEDDEARAAMERLTVDERSAFLRSF